MRATCAYIIYIPMGILCRNVLGDEFTRFQNAKTKRVRRLLCPYPTRIAFSNAVATDAVNRHKSEACLRSPHRKQRIVYIGVPIGVGEYGCKDTKIF